MRIALLVALLVAAPVAAQPTQVPSGGMVITESIRIAPGVYRLPSDSTAAIVIRGDNITVDFSGSVLVGSEKSSAPDSFAGTGISVEPGSNVRIKGATVRGYKVALLAREQTGLVVEDSDLSYNWRQRLKSTLEREHIDDWMSYHNNEEDEWLRFGAALYVRGCDGCRFQDLRVTGGQNGIMLTETTNSLVADNEITFNSSIGVGLYRSSDNLITHNKLDFNVRGYSHGIYNRGQDSAAILVYEQSSRNEFSHNSATHSGDGFFLWAGQTTMDTGEGGSNDNLIYRNDFSFAPTNGIEITFSRNRVLENYIEGCWHGIWGGYSFDTAIEGNTFVDNQEHIAIEHGQDILVRDNAFVGGDFGLRLWERESQPVDWGYSQARDVSSRDYSLLSNQFHEVGLGMDARKTENLFAADNTFNNTPGWPDGTETRDLGDQRERFDRSHPRDRAYILVDEWGPHDFRSPAFWPRSPRRAREQWFEIVGPDGRWSILETTGIDSVSARSGSVGDSIRVWRSGGASVDMRIKASFRGSEVVDRFGSRTPAGAPFQFEYNFSFIPIEWTVDFFAWETDPRESQEAFDTLLRGKPSHSDTTESLGYQWYRSPGHGLPADRFATRSVGHFEVQPGKYLLDLTSDDGVRVWLDDQLIHDDWTWHPPRQESLQLELGGTHTLRIEHFELDGFATLVAGLTRVR